MNTKAIVPRWMTWVLLAAAAYNLLWGAWAVLFPNSYFDWAGMQRPVYPEIWQCGGMIVDVYGVGYAIAAFDPFRYWPIVLVGLMGKVLGPLGFANALYDGTFTPKAGLTIVSNDLIWWIPFGMILLAAFRQMVLRAYERAEALPLDEALSSYHLANGDSLAETSRMQPVLLCFLRHFG